MSHVWGAFDLVVLNVILRIMCSLILKTLKFNIVTNRKMKNSKKLGPFYPFFQGEME